MKRLLVQTGSPIVQAPVEVKPGTFGATGSVNPALALVTTTSGIDEVNTDTGAVNRLYTPPAGTDATFIQDAIINTVPMLVVAEQTSSGGRVALLESNASGGFDEFRAFDSGNDSRLIDPSTLKVVEVDGRPELYVTSAGDSEPIVFDLQSQPSLPTPDAGPGPEGGFVLQPSDPTPSSVLIPVFVVNGPTGAQGTSDQTVQPVPREGTGQPQVVDAILSTEQTGTASTVGQSAPLVGLLVGVDAGSLRDRFQSMSVQSGTTGDTSLVQVVTITRDVVHQVSVELQSLGQLVQSSTETVLEAAAQLSTTVVPTQIGQALEPVALPATQAAASLSNALSRTVREIVIKRSEQRAADSMPTVVEERVSASVAEPGNEWDPSQDAQWQADAAWIEGALAEQFGVGQVWDDDATVPGSSPLTAMLLAYTAWQAHWVDEQAQRSKTASTATRPAGW